MLQIYFIPKYKLNIFRGVHDGIIVSVIEVVQKVTI